jgi:predicted aconitase with swiveling domain
VGSSLAGRVLVMPSGRGSSSSSYVLAEAIRAGTAPVAVVLGAADAIVALGAIVAAELYGIAVPVVVSADPALVTGSTVTVHAEAGGGIDISPG